MRRGSSTGIWSIGKVIAARKASIRAVITQCPIPVATTIITRQTSSRRKLTPPGALRRAKAVTSKSRPIKKPLILTTESPRVTIVPAISLAFGTANDRNTVKAVGATTAPKKTAAPSHKVNNTSRVKLSIAIKELIELIDLFQKPNFRRDYLRHQQLSRIRRGQ